MEQRKEYLKIKDRNPFEIRTRMIEIAQDYLEAQHKANMEFARQFWLDQMAQGAVTLDNINKYLPKMYDFEDITKKATQLYEFVLKKD